LLCASIKTKDPYYGTFSLMNSTIEQKIEGILSRGVGELIDPNGTFKEKLLKKAAGEYPQDIVIKFGVDPTQPDIHLGHAVVLQKLRQFQDLGCKIIFLVGDFTASIGDPSGKSKTRPEVKQKEIEHNMETYLDQIKKILLTEDALFSWIRNSDWFISPFDIRLPEDYRVSLNVTKDSQEITVPINPNSVEGRAIVYKESRMQKKDLGRENIESVSLANLLWTLRNITYGRLIQRDMFQKRIKSGGELYLHEILYPVLQGIDSFILAKIYGSCDLEIGGTDQVFNMLMGRDVMRVNKVEQQSVIALNLLVGTDGKEKMSKSLGNHIEIAGDPNDMYGKIMSIPDSSIVDYFKLCTYTPLDDVEKLQKQLEKDSKNPRDIKMRLAKEIVSLYHGEDAAGKAQEVFVGTFQKGNFPEDAQGIETEKGTELSTLLIEKEVIKSKTEFRRLIDEGAISNFDTGEKIETPEFTISESMNLKVGKKRFIKVVVK